MAGGDDGLVRVAIQYAGKRTSVSIDSVLFDGLCRREGGFEAACAWVRSAVLRVDGLVEAGDPLVQVSKAGLSRLIQRIMAHDLLRLGPHPVVPSAPPAQPAVPAAPAGWRFFDQPTQPALQVDFSAFAPGFIHRNSG